jgi:hypothetical protein
VGGPVFGRAHTAPTGAVIAGYVGDSTTVTTAAEAHLFDFGTMITVSCNLTAVFCWTMDTEITMAETGVLTDPDSGTNIGQDGVGPCFQVLAGTYRDSTIWRDAFRKTSKVGRRQGYCTVNTTTADWPCEADGDCGTSGVCSTAIRDGKGGFDVARGAFLNSRATAASTCFITEEK